MTQRIEAEKGWLDPYLDRYELDPDFVAETMALGLIEEALVRMEEEGRTRAHVAQAMSVSPSYLSRVLGAPPNLTLRSIAQLALALGTRPHVSLRPSCPPPGFPVAQSSSGYDQLPEDLGTLPCAQGGSTFARMRP